MINNYLENKAISLMKERDALSKQVKKLILQNKKLTEKLKLTSVICSEITRPYYLEVKIVAGGVTPYNTNMEIVEEFKKQGFTYKGEAITQTNEDGVAWTFMEKNNGLIKG